MSIGDGTAYNSELVLEFGDSHPIEPSKFTGGHTTVIPSEQVLSIVNHFIRKTELDKLAFVEINEGVDAGLWIRLVAQGEVFEQQLSSPSWKNVKDATQATVEGRLASLLEDWVCETKFGWGENRTVRSMPS